MYVVVPKGDYDFAANNARFDKQSYIAQLVTACVEAYRTKKLNLSMLMYLTLFLSLYLSVYVSLATHTHTHTHTHTQTNKRTYTNKQD